MPVLRKKKMSKCWGKNAKGAKAMANNSQIKAAVILASGSGTRMRRKEQFPSKPMTPIKEKPLISYIIDLMIGGGVEKIYIVYQTATSDVLKLPEYFPNYTKYIEYVEEDVQKGTLLSFSRVKDIFMPPFLMAFADIIANKDDFNEMLSAGCKYISSEADVIIQTVQKPSVFSETAFLTERERIVRYQKKGITGQIKENQERKCGGMVYLWLSNPFPIVEQYLCNQVNKFSIFLEAYIANHLAYEMPIHDMWDIDTPEAVLLTEELLKRRGG